MQTDTIFITGGAGFIGSMVNSMLNASGFQTIILDNLSTGNATSVQNGRLIVGDIGNPLLLNQIFSENKITAVMHFAAKTDVGESVQNPDLYYKSNVTDTLTLLEAMQKARISNFIFSSTAAVYGNPVTNILNEESDCHPINPYGETKLIIEKTLQNADFNSCSLRYFNAAGGDPSGLIKYALKKENNLIPIILNCILKDEPLTVYGSDYPTKDGTCIRDYIHVADIGNAHILALKKLLNGKVSLCYNLGNKQGFSVLDVIRASEEVTGRTLKVVIGPRRPGDPAILIANAEKAQKELGWNPRYPQIKEMIKHAYLARQ